MEWHSPLLEKSFSFAVDIASFCLDIQKKEKEYVLTKQLLKSGTSIGANIEEATQAENRKDFISKLSIALKEAHESRYWLRIFKAMNLGSAEKAEEFLSRMKEIIRMLSSSLRTSRSRL